MKFIAIATIGLGIASVNCVDSHAGHDHGALKPIGPFWGTTNYTAKSGKAWNTNEIQLIFKEDNTFDMKWWFGYKDIPGVAIDKQTFSCDAVPFAFNETSLRLAISPAASPCIAKINGYFPKGFQLTDPFYMPVNHTNGNVKFLAAKGMISVEMVPINAPLAQIPSGVDGLAPETTPLPRIYADDEVKTTVAPGVAQPLNAAVDNSTTTSTTKSYARASIASLAVISITVATLFI